MLVDSRGLFSGLITGWNSSLTLTNSIVVSSSLCIKFWSKGLDQSLNFLNLYGTYEEKQLFWESFFARNLFEKGI